MSLIKSFPSNLKSKHVHLSLQDIIVYHYSLNVNSPKYFNKGKMRKEMISPPLLLTQPLLFGHAHLKMDKTVSSLFTR